MSYTITKPSKQLSPYVKQYWMITNAVKNGESYQHRVIPNGLIELSFYIGSTPQSNDISFEGNCNIQGQLNEYYDLTITDNLDIFSVTFLPQGVKEFFNIPVSEFYNSIVNLRDIIKNDINHIEDRLSNTFSFNERVIIIEDFLTTLRHKKIKNPESLRIDESIQTINRLKAMVNIEELSKRACLNRKKYERVFKESIGISPRAFLKVVRSQHAIQTRVDNMDNPLTNVAYECGYYDQSHMINDFKKLTGLSPKKFFKQCNPESDYFS